MTSTSLISVDICLKFLEGAAVFYGEGGLAQGSKDAVGADLRACVSAPVTIPAGERRMIPTGVAIEPKQSGVAGFVYSRSGLGAAQGITVAQGVGVIDPDYRGEIKVFLLNTSRENYTVQPGDRIAQLAFQPYFRPLFQVVEELGDTDRAQGGFGHTGR